MAGVLACKAGSDWLGTGMSPEALCRNKGTGRPGAALGAGPREAGAGQGSREEENTTRMHAGGRGKAAPRGNGARQSLPHAGTPAGPIPRCGHCPLTARGHVCGRTTVSALALSAACPRPARPAGERDAQC